MENPPSTTIHYICERCGARIDDANVVFDSDPESYHDSFLRKFKTELRGSDYLDKLPKKPYHTDWCYVGYGNNAHGHREKYLCGPLHVETTQEYFVHWIGGSMKQKSVK